ncbi:serine protease [Permianibacter aggregans]|nr:serine protease [Permianibacter aggregans]
MSMTLAASAVALACCSVSPVAEAAADERFVDVIVRMKSHQDGNAAGNKARAQGLALGHGAQVKHSYGTVLTGFAARIPEARLKQLQADPNVASVEFDRPVKMSPKPGGGGGGGSANQVTPWGISRIGSPTSGGSGVHVFVLDTGIDADHADLVANLSSNSADHFAAVSCKGKCNKTWDDDQGHGTHVAGSIAAANNSIDVIGVAPNATLHAVKVLDSRGSGAFSGIIAGIDFTANWAESNNQVVVANLSLGGGGTKSGSCNNGSFTGNDSFHEAFCRGAAKGVVFVVAAGNDGDDAANHTPAAYDDAVITVSATSSADNWPSWSNYGTKSASWTSRNSAPVGIAAPGVSILSTAKGGGTTTMSGTSMASPHVAGAAALYLDSHSVSRNFNAFLTLRSALLNSAESTSGFSNTSGNPHSEDFLKANGL